MASAYVELILGISLGVIVGVLPAIVAFLLGTALPSLAERRFARLVVGLVSLPAAVVVAVFLDVAPPGIEQAPRIVAGGTVVVLSVLYGFSLGARVGSALRRDGGAEREHGRPLSSSAIDSVDATGQVTISPSTDVGDVSGYPPLSEDLRATIASEQWRLPADLPLSELEARIERQLRTTYGLSQVDVTVDPRGTASVDAAPPVTGIARRVPDGCRAVSLPTLLPDGVTPGDVAVIETEAGTVDAVILSASPGRTREERSASTDRFSGPTDRSPSGEPGSDHRSLGDGTDGSPTSSDDLDRVTVAVPTAAADALLAADGATVAVKSRDTRPDFRAISSLDRSGYAVRVTTVDADVLDALGSDRRDVSTFAARPPGEDAADDWTFDPDLSSLETGWEAVVVGEAATLGALLDDSMQAADGVVQA